MIQLILHNIILTLEKNNRNKIKNKTKQNKTNYNFNSKYVPNKKVKQNLVIMIIIMVEYLG